MGPKYNRTEEEILEQLSAQVDSFFKRAGDVPRSEDMDQLAPTELYEKTYKLRLAHTNRALERLYQALDRGED